ncbi:MAG TPA: PAS domain-containing protein [Longimicrobium sp.]|nr:PAS domain-containing protein [Longimicrobium sp.]
MTTPAIVSPELRAHGDPRAGERARAGDEGAWVGLWDWDVVADELYWDDGARALHGVAPGVPVTRELLLERIHPGDRERLLAAIEASVDPAARGSCEAGYRVETPAGERWIHASGRVLWSGDGAAARAVRVIGILRDDTRARAAERALAERDERLRAALHASGMGTFRWDIRTGVLEWDDGLDRLFGLEPGSTVRSLSGFLAAVHPDDRGRVADACARCAARGADFDEEFRVVWPDGTVRWLDDKGRTFTGADGEPAYMTGACMDVTGRKLAVLERERLLQAQNAAAVLARQRMAELEAFYAGAPVGLALLDRELRYVRVNEQLAAVSGLPSAAHAGLAATSMPPFDSAGLGELLRQVLETGNPVAPFPVRSVPARGGPPRTWLVTCYPVAGVDGGVARVGAVVDDISALEQASEALRQSEGRLRRILDSGIVGSFFWHVDGGITDANDAFLALLGFTRDDLRAGRLDWRRLTPPRWREQDEIQVAELLATGLHGPYEKEYLAADGTPVPVLIASAFFEGSRTEGVALCLDRTQQRRAEQALRDREHQLREALTETELARAMAESTAHHLHRQHAVTAAVAGALREEEVAGALLLHAVPLMGAQAALVLRVEAGELVCVGHTGYAESDLRHWMHYPVTLGTPAGDVADRGEPVFLENVKQWQARYPRWTAWVAAHGFVAYAGLPLRAGARVVGVMVLNFAEPRRFTAQDRETLLGMAGVGAQAFERARLYRQALDARREAEEARAAAETANQAKSAFLAAMSHDLRTPLNAITGYADLIEMGLRGPVTPEQTRDLSRIRRSTEHLLGLINDVLSFATLSAGSLTFDVRDVPLAPILADAEVMVVPQAAARGLRLAVHPSPPDALVHADADKVRQILLNLLGNAIKFTPSGGAVEVTVEVDDAAARVHVRDTGVGIPADRLGAVFEPFVQVSRADPGSGRGVGLGLAISEQLARAMGGTLSVSSTLGAGSTFTLALPLAAAADAPPA